ncbi:unnamed protein product [Rotaria sp. Silwood2]|nr:unnamed protein product [Rotaria sp. Silwood2]
MVSTKTVILPTINTGKHCQTNLYVASAFIRDDIDAILSKRTDDINTQNLLPPSPLYLHLPLYLHHHHILLYHKLFLYGTTKALFSSIEIFPLSSQHYSNSPRLILYEPYFFFL